MVKDKELCFGLTLIIQFFAIIIVGFGFLYDKPIISITYGVSLFVLAITILIVEYMIYHKK